MRVRITIKGKQGAGKTRLMGRILEALSNDGLITRTVEDYQKTGVPLADVSDPIGRRPYTQKTDLRVRAEIYYPDYVPVPAPATKAPKKASKKEIGEPHDPAPRTRMAEEAPLE